MSHVVQAIALRDLPSARDFVLSAGFAGVAASVAAVIVLCAVLYGILGLAMPTWDSRRTSEGAHLDKEFRVSRSAVAIRQ
jgi:hypothetical protein